MNSHKLSERYRIRDEKNGFHDVAQQAGSSTKIRVVTLTGCRSVFKYSCASKVHAQLSDYDIAKVVSLSCWDGASCLMLVMNTTKSKVTVPISTTGDS